MDNKQLSKDTGISEELLNTMRLSITRRVKSENPNLSDADVEAAANAELEARCRKAAFRGGNREEFDGIIVGVSNVRDLLEMRRNKCQTTWAMNKDKAIADKLTDHEGRPLNTFGQIIKPEDKALVRSAIAIAAKAGDAEPKVCILTIGIASANDEVPLGVPVKIKGMDKGMSGNKLTVRCNSNAIELQQKNAPPLEKVLDTYFKDYFVDFNELNAWHQQNEQDRDRLFVSKAMVLNCNEQVTQNGSKMVNLCSIGDSFEQVFAWVPADMKLYPSGSHVYVLGSTSLNRDMMLNLNLVGMYPIKVAEVDAEAIPLAEDSETDVPSKKMGGEQWVE